MASLNNSVLQKSATINPNDPVEQTNLTCNCSAESAANLSRTPLRQHVYNAVEQYFAELEGQHPTNLYETIIQEVEKPLLQVVLEQTQQNQSKTAKILGLNRGTLRKKMSQYDLL